MSAEGGEGEGEGEGSGVRACESRAVRDDPRGKHREMRHGGDEERWCVLLARRQVSEGRRGGGRWATRLAFFASPKKTFSTFHLPPHATQEVGGRGTRGRRFSDGRRCHKTRRKSHGIQRDETMKGQKHTCDTSGVTPSRSCVVIFFFREESSF